MIAYYKRDEAEPPGAQLVPLAKALRVSTDEFLGHAASPLARAKRKAS